VSNGGCKVDICDEFIQVGTTYHKRQYADDTDDLETCNTYSVSYDVPSLTTITNLICLSHGGSEFVHKQAFASVWLMYKRYIDGTTGRRSDAAHHYVYNQAHNQNLQVWDGKRVKRIIFE
jgi:alcohol oxidase